MNTLHLFKQDLRLKDNPSLIYATSKGPTIVSYHYRDSDDLSEIGSAGKCWLYKSLQSLNKSLSGNLCITKGNLIKTISDLCNNHNIELVCWNKCYEPWFIKEEKELKNHLESLNIKVKIFNGSVLLEPQAILKNDNTPFKVFTPFYKSSLLNNQKIRTPLDAPKKNNFINSSLSISIDDLKLLPKNKWGNKILNHWEVSENAAHEKLEIFIQKKLNIYKDGRNYPEKQATSYLSPYLHWGQISPYQIWSKINELSEDQNTLHFKSELGWREFSYYQLFNNPDLQTKNIQSKFNFFPWSNNLENLKKWQKGLTGIPIIDAGMRELWETGYMHNRVRMIVGSFLVKNLLIHWKYGEEWFRDCLLDADVANNSASWQWVAGCGADAAPYFRIFNPITQSIKFDPAGSYIKKYLPELKKLEPPILFSPWESSSKILKEANITLGETYPYPIVDLKDSRDNALTAFQDLKGLK